MSDITGLRQGIFNGFGQRRPMEQGSFDPGTIGLMQPTPGGTPFDPQVIGNPFQPQTINMPPPEMAPSGGNDIAGLLSQIGQMQTPEQDKYQALLSARPERGSPGLLRSILAMGAGLDRKDPNPYKTMEDIKYAPYNREMADWQSQLEPQAKAAQLENATNSQERALKGNALTFELGQRKAAETERYNRERTRIGDEKNALYRFKSMNPGWKLDTRTPRIIAFNPATGEKRDLGDSGNLSDADKLALEGENSIALEDRRQSGRTALEGTRQENRIVLEDHRSLNDIKEKETIPGKAGSNSRTGGLKFEEYRNNVLQQFYDRDKKYRKFIQSPETVNGNFQLIPPSERWFGSGPDPKEAALFKEIQDELYGTDAKSTTTTQSVESPPTSGQTKPASSGSKLFPTPEGGFDLGVTKGTSSYLNPADPTASVGRANKVGAEDMIQGIRKYTNSMPGTIKGQIRMPETETPDQGPAQPAKPNLANREINGPNGVMRIPPDKAAILDKKTGQMLQVPRANLDAAMATGDFVLVMK